MVCKLVHRLVRSRAHLQELQHIIFVRSLVAIVSLFKEGMLKLPSMSEGQAESVAGYVISAFSGYQQRVLSVTNEALLVI